MLADRYDATTLIESFVSASEWRPFPPACDRAAWTQLLQDDVIADHRDWLVARAEEAAASPTPPLPATLYMEFARTGNRRRYEIPYFERRKRFGYLVLAECFESEGRYPDAISDELWAILGEPSWSIPAHASRYEGDALPREDSHSVDLFACETAAVLAEALYLLAKPLEHLSQSLANRVRGEIDRRVIKPVEDRDDLFWLQGRNNWGPWCASNVLMAAMYTVGDKERLARLSHKLMQVVDRFIDTYHPDGGCTEGPRYWGVGAGAMLIFLELLHSRTRGSVDIYDEPLVKAMGHFIVSAHIAGPWFINFADSTARIDLLRRGSLYRYGKRTNDDELRNLALLNAHGWNPAGEPDPAPVHGYSGSDLTHSLRELFWMPSGETPRRREANLSEWLPHTQVLVARGSSHEDRGLVLAAKGGHNGECHNHNDVGQFMLYLDGRPVVVDAGVETYSRKTFGPQRYEIWSIRGSGHNAPVIDGVEQSPGNEFGASDVCFAEDSFRHCLTMNLTGIYPREAPVLDIVREVTLRRQDAGHAVVEDRMEFARAGIPVRIRLFCTEKPLRTDSGAITLSAGERRIALEASAEGGQPPDVDIDPLTIEDDVMRSSWGDVLYRVDLHFCSESRNLTTRLVFRPH